MRLLNVETFKLEEFFYETPPPYAILSHTWGKDEEEVSYRDVLDGKLSVASTRPLKVSGCCKQAQEDGYRYVWIDTCCIDKTNSVELQEAINSMFRWYQNAAICYAFLSDVPRGDDPHKPGSAFVTSRWFQRGWTLQELIAPLNFRFYDNEWECIGTKGDLCDVVEQITGIPTPFLLGIADIHHASVAQRMSWAALRVTKRQEDIAYCLLGIFGIFMPLIYGEGDKAFRRLQEQIMKDVGDDSIFAWDLQLAPLVPPLSRVIPGVALARAPLHFRNSGGVAAVGHLSTQSFDQHGGSLRFSVTLYTAPNGELLGLLNCGLEQEPSMMVGIPLVAAPGEQPNHYMRQEGRSAVLVPNFLPRGGSITMIHLQLDGRRQPPTVEAQSYWFHIRKSHPKLELFEVFPEDCWHKERALIEAAIEPGTAGRRRILTRFRDNKPSFLDFVAVLEVEPQTQPRCNLMVASGSTTLSDISHALNTCSDKILGQQAASNDVSNISMALETLQSSPSQRRFIVKPVALSGPPSVTINATTLIWKSGVSSVLNDLRQVKEARSQQTKTLKDQLWEKWGEASKVQEELKTVKAKIKALMEEEHRLDEEHRRQRQEEHQLILAHKRAMKERADASKRITATQCLLDVHKPGQTVEQFNAISEAEEQILPFAIEKGNYGLVRQLLHNGVGVTGKDLFGRTALHHAAATGDPLLVRSLIQRDADLDASAPDMHDTTPLHVAVDCRWVDVVGVLLDNGADVDKPDAAGATPLHYAAQDGIEPIARLLIKRGASVAAENEDGKTPLQLAELSGKHDVANILKIAASCKE